MTAPFAGFPAGTPGGGFGTPGAPQQAAPTQGFVLNIPLDPTWEPMTSSDVLEKDGYYSAAITGEKPRDNDGKPQLVLTMTIIDQDAAGKVLAKFMPHAETTQKNTWFLWRGLARSIFGGTAGKSAWQYTPGCLMGKTVFFKTEPYAGKDGTVSTGVGDWVTKEEYEEAVRTNRHRWVSKPPQAMGGAGALPGGLPGFGGGMPGLPGAPGQMPGAPSFPGLPGAPGGGMPMGVPQPTGMPMQAPQQPVQPIQPQQPQPQYPTHMAPPATQTGFAPAPSFPPQVQQPQQPQVQVAPAQTPPQNPFAGFPTNGAVPAPAPTAAGLAASFPGLPGQK